MKALRYRHLNINISSIVSFEHIRVCTIGRPSGSSKGDNIQGVRILLSTSATYIIIDDKAPTFDTRLKTEKHSASWCLMLAGQNTWINFSR